MKKELIKSSEAILMASIPSEAPRVPAPISEGTSIIFIFFMHASFGGEDRAERVSFLLFAAENRTSVWGSAVVAGGVGLLPNGVQYRT